uniref:Sec-independent protein translocase component tatA/E n=1 Tax=Jakoba libera TaxID=143017 RepID=M4QDD8_JAKLI|nr:Sec-independent protein translocase component tatA/E [Jakoba libera]AGH24185.1 Sec-independent protein translocase component tatA/E [Jakoba libera]
MSIGLGQLLVIVLVAFFLFGKFPTLKEDLTKGIKAIQDFIQDSTKESSQETKTMTTLQDEKKKETTGHFQKTLKQETQDDLKKK